MFQLQPPPTARRPPGKSSTAREYATVSLAPQEKNPFSTAHAQLSNPRSGWRSAPLLLSLSLALSRSLFVLQPSAALLAKSEHATHN